MASKHLPLCHSYLLSNAAHPLTFTRYEAHLGFTPEELEPLDVGEPVPALPRPAMPPYNGYGTLEDSKQNCIALVPKPPRKDMHKLMNKDKIILRWGAGAAQRCRAGRLPWSAGRCGGCKSTTDP